MATLETLQDRLDRLKTYPLNTAPDTWVLNEMFLQKIIELCIVWAEAGYAWKWGHELEYDLRTIEDAAAILKNFHDPETGKVDPTRYADQLHVQDNLERARQSNIQGDSVFLDALEKVRDYFCYDPDAAVLMRETKWTFKEVMDHLNGFEEDLTSEDKAKANKARENIFLALMHVMPVSEGGLRDIIEPRFGDHGLGLGWNDYRPEVRTRLANDPLDATNPLQFAEHMLDVIEHSLQYVDILTTQAAKFGLVMDLSRCGASHLHFSIWRISDKRNLMEMHDKDDTAFCDKVLHGLYTTSVDMPFMMQDYTADNIVMNMNGGSTRANTIRQEPDNWEFRRPSYSALSHTARYMMLIMMGAAFGTIYNNPNQPGSDIRKTNLFFNTKQCPHPVTRHRFGSHVSGLASILDHCQIRKDGSLFPDSTIIAHYIIRLKEEIGITNLQEYKLQSQRNPKIYFDLAHPTAWEAMLREFSINEENQLDLSALPEDSEVAEAFRAIEITGRRTVIHSTNAHVYAHPHATEFCLKRFPDFASARVFFTPDECTKIATHYTAQSQKAMNTRAMLDCDYVNALAKGSPDEDPWTLAWAAYYKLYNLPSQQIDTNIPIIEKVTKWIDLNVRIDRSKVISSYTHAMRPYFATEAKRRIDDLTSRKPDQYERLVEIFERSVQVAVSRHVNPFREDNFAFIESFLETIANNSLLHMLGVSPISFEAAMSIPRATFMKGITAMLFDPIYSDGDISRAVAQTFLEMPSTLDNIRLRLDIDSKDQVTQDIFEIACAATLDAVHQIYHWTEKNYGKACLNALPYNESYEPQLLLG